MNLSVYPRPCVLRCEMLSKLADADAFCREVRELLVGAGLVSEVFPVEILLRESLNNAIIHGNCADCDKKILAEVRIGRKGILLRVTDEGEGFDCNQIVNRTPNPEAVCGRGLTIYSLYAHRISFNSKGNRICLWRALRGDESREHIRVETRGSQDRCDS